MPCVKSITEQWLKERGYHGLCNQHRQCGCQLGDLVPCSALREDCEAAIEVQPEDRSYDFWMAEPQWFDPKKHWPEDKTRVLWILYKNGQEKPGWLHDNAEIEAWRYDLPPGSWREGEDQSKLPGVKK